VTFSRRQFLNFSAVAAAAPAFPEIVWAQTYPARPVRLIVPYPAGGPNDTIARIIASKLSETWGQPFHIDNIPAGAGNICTAAASLSSTDG